MLVSGGPRVDENERIRAAELLIATMRALAGARTRTEVATIVKSTARALVAADGASFVLRDGVHCFYLDEDAISPLWKGQRFLLERCVSGWVMLNAQQVAMADIYQDERVPHDAYRPTFVKSLVMTPVRRTQPIAAIGIYWSEHHVATDLELKLLQDLADTTAVALENAQVYQELEQRVADRTERLREANLELEAFAHTVAHDLRSPLHAILGFAELVTHAKDLGSAQAMAAQIERAGGGMNDLIGALLEFAHNARDEAHKRELDLSLVARRVAETLCAAGHYVGVRLSIAPQLTAFADEQLIEVVISNLLGNALKYSAKAAAPHVEFGLSADSAQERIFFVRDNGAGFESSQASRLFRPFQRLHAAQEFAGHGVGLATAARIISRHGGRIWAESSRGSGATFYFSLPKRG